jgi:hypothetical protein
MNEMIQNYFSASHCCSLLKPHNITQNHFVPQQSRGVELGVLGLMMAARHNMCNVLFLFSAIKYGRAVNAKHPFVYVQTNQGLS